MPALFLKLMPEYLMESFDLHEFLPYIFLIVGLASILFSIFKKSTKAKLKETGFKAEGIIFALEKETAHYSESIDEPSNINNKVTIRFVTNNKEWITGTIQQEFASFYTNQYKEGDPVDVYYDPETPSNFYVDTKQNEKIVRLIIAGVGLIFSALGLYQLLSGT